MITIITRWEDKQMPRDLEQRMWRQIKGAFEVNQLVFVEGEDQMGDAIRASQGQRVFLEPRGQRSVKEIPKGDIVLVLGNTAMNNLKFANAGETYRIDTPGPTDMYGTNAAAIALAMRLDR